MCVCVWQCNQDLISVFPTGQQSKMIGHNQQQRRGSMEKPMLQALLVKKIN